MLEPQTPCGEIVGPSQEEYSPDLTPISQRRLTAQGQTVQPLGQKTVAPTAVYRSLKP